MQVIMEPSKIKAAYTHDLNELMRSDSIGKYSKQQISTELDIRYIIYTSASDGIASVIHLEAAQNVSAIHKLTVLAEAQWREDCGLKRQSLLKKISAATRRLERRTGLYMLHKPNSDSIAPWYPEEDYNPKKHAPSQQHLINGVPVDPCLPYNFDNTPNEERDPQEIADWWGRAFIVSARNRQTGEICYDIRRLDGGAWDRSTYKGTSTSLDFSVDVARRNTESQQLMRNAA